METKLQKLFGVLRWCGAAMIFAAAGTFLVQSWTEVGDVKRYLALLGMTLLLPAVSYVCGIRFQEGRSARVLLLTLLALVTIHGGLLGGFVLSQFGNAPPLEPIAQWVAPSQGAAIALVVGAALVLAPMMWAAFRVLARQHATLLTLAAGASHAVLLIPDRSASTAALSIAPIMVGTTWAALRVKPRALEPWLALASVAAPAFMIAARQVLFYDVTSALFGVLLASAGLGLFALGRKVGDRSIERVSIVPTLVSIVAFMEAMRLDWLSFSGHCMTYGLVAAAVLFGCAMASEGSRGFFIRTAAVLNAVLCTVALLIDPRPWASLEAIALGLTLMSVGFISGRRPSLYGGISLASLGFITQVAHAIEAFRPSGWLALAGLGLGVVALTAWLERRARAARTEGAGVKMSQDPAATLSQ